MRRRQPQTAGGAGLDLVPVLNAALNPLLLLLCAHFVQRATVDVNPPIFSEDGDPPDMTIAGRAS
jgi:hypothetical protein